MCKFEGNLYSNNFSGYLKSAIQWKCKQSSLSMPLLYPMNLTWNDAVNKDIIMCIDVCFYLEIFDLIFFWYPV